MEHEDGTYNEALELKFDSANCKVASDNKMQKNWTEPISQMREISQMILKLETTDVKRFKAYQNKLGWQWLNVIPCKIFRLNLSNQQLRIAIGLRLGSKICKKKKYRCNWEKM